uniref:OXC n=1 Tax=Arundo donax TaxID=35708 RepID=A0A0A9DDS9_ARUDO
MPNRTARWRASVRRWRRAGASQEPLPSPSASGGRGCPWYPPTSGSPPPRARTPHPSQSRPEVAPLDGAGPQLSRCSQPMSYVSAEKDLMRLNRRQRQLCEPRPRIRGGFGGGHRMGCRGSTHQGGRRRRWRGPGRRGAGCRRWWWP